MNYCVSLLSQRTVISKFENVSLINCRGKSDGDRGPQGQKGEKGEKGDSPPTPSPPTGRFINFDLEDRSLFSKLQKSRTMLKISTLCLFSF